MGRGDKRRRLVVRVGFVACVASVVSLVAGACAVAPSPLRPASAPAHEIFVLQWWLIIISLAVCAIIAVLLVIPLRRRVRRVTDAPVTSGGGTRWIVVGVVTTAVIIAAVFIYTVVVLADTATPGSTPKLTVEVIGHRWWWEVRYPSSDSGRTAITANEIHIPVGEPVRLRVTSADVIHSFWVPQLQGKIDLNPGGTNTFWLRADTAGRFRGQCAEYCGLQHAHMIFWVVAESRPTFEAWLARQRQPASTPRNPLAVQGEHAFLTSTCAACHTIRGTTAVGTLGPDLTHLAGRETIAAGTLANTRGNLSGWITNAQSLKPGAAMPRLDLAPATMHQIVAYLESLH
jgi:cytochrome c oxidase subunit 2